MVVEDLTDPVRFGVTIRVVGFLPPLGSLKRHIMADQDLTQPFALDVHDPMLVVAETVDEFADRPAGELLTHASGRWWAVSTMNNSSSIRSGGDGHPPTEGPATPSPCR